jgi:uncharacterized protein (TIGR00661 family)
VEPVKNNVNVDSNQLKRVLLAPLDWGLGHATRCIPLIHRLIQDGNEVFLAGDGKVKILLSQEFPHLPFILLEGYNVHYSRTKQGLPFTMLLQVPKILKAIHYEHHWLQGAMQQWRFDVVISDNRYGLFHPEAYCVFITHQLLIKTPYRMVERMLQRINYRLINRFNECWVPDQEHPPYLAGELAHPSKLPKVPVKYIGPLSRLHLSPSSAPGQHILILLSGPEPQRSMLEQKILMQLEDINSKVLLVRGMPGETSIPHATRNVIIKNHLPSQQLSDAFAQASIVISRCGYSTVMDLMATRKKCILIPTPGQTEQEYLAKHLMQQHLALCIPQKEFHLESALKLAASFPFQTAAFNWDDHILSGVIRELAI